jgi:hypothetical protein
MDIVSKINGNTLSATEFNQMPTELEAVQTSSGQTSSDAVLNQVSIGISRYAANNFYIDSGSANTYVLTLAASMINPVSSTVGYFVGMTICFRAGNANTGASTVNVNSAGVKNLKKEDGTTDLASGDILTTRDSIFRYDGTVFRLVINALGATTSTSGTALLPKPITIANNVSDTNNDIDFGAGVFQFDDGSGQAVATALTKRLDATFVAGNNQGGLDTGAKANSTRYYMFAIYNPTTLVSDFLFSASKASPTMPSGYTKKQYLGCAITDGSGNIRNGTYYVSKSQYEFVYNSAMIVDLNVTTVPTASRSAAVITAPINSYALLGINYSDDDATTSYVLLTSSGQTDTAPSGSNSTVGANNATGLTVPPTYFLLDNSAQIYYRGTDASVTVLSIVTKGWKEFY